MPTKYKPVLNHESVDIEIDLDEIAIKAINLWPAIREAFTGCDIHLEYDDRERILTDIVSVLTRFVLTCDALPLRTPNMMLATANEIKRNPQKFLNLSERFDPEVNAMVLDEAARLSATTNVAIQEFELGLGIGPPPSEIARAADNVVQLLENRRVSKIGRPHLGLQAELAVSLGRVFRSKGGKITRITFDGESGPFHNFLDVLLPIVRKFARKAGFDLNVTTMVEKAQKVLGLEVFDK